MEDPMMECPSLLEILSLLFTIRGREREEERTVLYGVLWRARRDHFGDFGEK
jgi:hypothetical protein